MVSWTLSVEDCEIYLREIVILRQDNAAGSWVLGCPSFWNKLSYQLVTWASFRFSAYISPGFDYLPFCSIQRDMCCPFWSIRTEFSWRGDVWIRTYCNI